MQWHEHVSFLTASRILLGSGQNIPCNTVDKCFSTHRWPHGHRGHRTDLADASFGLILSSTIQTRTAGLTCSLKSGQRPITPYNTKTRLRDILHAVATRQLHAAFEFGMESVQHELNTFLAIICQTPKSRPTDPAVLSTKSESFEDVCSTTDAAIDMDSDTPSRGFDTFWKSIDR